MTPESRLLHRIAALLIERLEIDARFPTTHAGGGKAQREADELAAMLVAARMCTPAANDPPDLPFPPGPPADQAAGLNEQIDILQGDYAQVRAPPEPPWADRLRKGATVAYAERLQRALTVQGHSLTLAAAISVAKEMGR